MSTATEVSVVRVLPPAERSEDGTAPVAAPTTTWEPPRSSRRRSPALLIAFAVVAGVAAMVLGGLAVLSAARSSESTPTQTASVTDPGALAERRALALLAKPSTERVVFKGSGGRLVLAVGSGGRAALLLRGLAPATPAKPYRAWVVGSRRAVTAARFTGEEKAVLLSVPVARGASVVIGTERRTALRPGSAALVAVRP